MRDDRDEEGQYIEKYSDEAFLKAVDSIPVASTQNVADEVGCSYDLAYRRLKQLEQDGHVEHDGVGRSFIWLPALPR
jgi:CTP-dependent riboflavin kinase